MISSKDGTNWIEIASSSDDYLNGVGGNSDVAVVVGSRGSILVSQDGRTWTDRQIGKMNSFNSITYGPAGFVAVGDATGHSQTGGRWEQIDPGVTNRLTSITSGGGIYVAVGDAGTIVTSSDGKNWQKEHSGSTEYLVDVVYGKGRFLATAPNGIVLESSDGRTWMRHDTGLRQYLKHAAYGNGRFVAIGNDSVVVSEDAQQWTTQRITRSPVTAIAFGNGNFVMNGSALMLSKDGLNWTIPAGSTAFGGLSNIVYGLGWFITFGGGSSVYTSADGVAWGRKFTPASLIRGAAFGPHSAVLVGLNGTILESNPLISDLTVRMSTRDELVLQLSEGEGLYRLQSSSDLRSPFWLDHGLISGDTVRVPLKPGVAEYFRAIPTR
jgi:hypothetical protein